MKWIEIIELRSIQANAVLLDLDIVRYIEETKPDIMPVCYSVCSHASLATDVCIFFGYHTDAMLAAGSQLGASLRAILKPFGLVSHNMWRIENIKSLKH